MLFFPIGEQPLVPTYLDLLGEGGAEHHGLTQALGGHGVLLHDAPDLGLEAHVEHAVRLVQNQVALGGREGK